MAFSPVALTLVLTLLWFVMYWIVAGVFFAIIGLARFMRMNTARFSCLFTLLSVATAYGAAWTGVAAVTQSAPRCLSGADALYQVIPSVLQCAPMIVLSNGILWFIVLLAAGIGLMFASRLPDRPVQISQA